MRISCCVPFCGRTRGERVGSAKRRRGSEWICADHWRGVSLNSKQMKRRWERKARKTYPTDKLRDFVCGNAVIWWNRCKAEAIEAAAGIR